MASDRERSAWSSEQIECDDVAQRERVRRDAVTLTEFARRFAEALKQSPRG
jgi:hypothetical protein